MARRFYMIDLNIFLIVKRMTTGCAYAAIKSRSKWLHKSRIVHLRPEKLYRLPGSTCRRCRSPTDKCQWTILILFLVAFYLFAGFADRFKGGGHSIVSPFRPSKPRVMLPLLATLTLAFTWSRLFKQGLFPKRVLPFVSCYLA